VIRRLVVLSLLLAAALAAPASAAGDLTGRLLVSVDRPGEPIALAAARPAGPRVPEIGLITVRPRAGESLRSLAKRLRANPRVRAVEAEKRGRPRFVPDDPALTDLETAPGTPPGTVVQWWVARTGLFEAWDLARGTDALVGVIDSGVDGGHPELSGKVRETIDADPTGSAGPLVDETGHGTHVATLACGASGDGIGIASAGLECGLVVVKTDFSDGSVAEAIVEATNRGVNVLNLSFGTDGNRSAPIAVVDAIRYAAARNVVVVAAAADQDTEEQGDPANIVQPTGTGSDLSSNLGLSVTAATHSDQRAAFAGRGSQISLAAYGAFDRGSGPRGLMAGWPQNEASFERGSPGAPPAPPCRCRTTYRGDSRYAYLQGTSMATAIVSGVAALVRDLNPDLPSADVVRLLKETARRPPGSGWNPDLGWGIVDARTAVEAARRIDRRPPVSRLRAPKHTRRRTITLRWSGQDVAPPGVAASGVARYEIWRSTRNRAPVKIAATGRTTHRVEARAGSTYRFFTVAIDRAGNREDAPGRPDATVRALR
jgi:serine protease